MHAKLQNISIAVEYYKQALTIHREVNDCFGIATQCFNMAHLYARCGKIDQALSLASDAITYWARIGNAAYAERAQELVAQLERQGR